MAGTHPTPTPWLARWRRRPTSADTDWADMGTCIGLDAAQPAQAPAAVAADEPAREGLAMPVRPRVATPTPGPAPTAAWWGRLPGLARGPRPGPKAR